MRKLWAAILLVLFAGSVFADANIIIINTDPAGVGFNDPTPAIPVGGNTGTTLGEQRLIAFNFAADLWGSVLGSSPTIRVSASFSALNCTSTSAVLGSAGPATIHANFAGVPFASTWYPQALANHIAGFDLSSQADMTAQFNGNIDFNNNCLSGTNWYYGLDNNGPGNTIDFLNTVMHELGHGLGFSGFVNLTTGALQGGLPDIFTRFTFDNAQMLHWNEMSNSQRIGSASNSGNLVWDGPNAAALADDLLSFGTDVNGFPRLYAPSTLQVGSSVYHWDTGASPNALMEPFLSGSVEASATLDLTPAQLKDIGWTIDDQDDDLIPDSYDNCPSVSNTDQSDVDSDGLGDACDNCIEVSNADQYDSNGDGFGNICDADVNNDNTVNFLDLALIKQVFLSTPPAPAWDADADLDNSGAVNFADLSLLKTQFLRPPGPSALVQ